MSTIYKLENTIKEYSWGSKTAFSALFNKSEPAENPQAELWMGAHPLASSIAMVGNERISLVDLIRANPEEILGIDAIRKNDTLPFLLKILASEKPLSIQAHPDKRQAEAGFARENEAHIPIDSPKRMYRDANHKPELICALTPFWALCGFRPYPDIVRSFVTLPIEKIKYETDIFSKNLSEEGLKSFYNFIMTLDDDTKREVIRTIDKSG
jgi:mannose-6-phosphate isomerase